MRVRRQRPADRQPVGAGLLLRDAPLPCPALLPLDQRRDQRGPFDAGLDRDRAAFGVERADLIQRSQIDEERVGPELLAAHRMPAAAERHASALGRRRADRRLHLVGRARRQDPADARFVQLRVEVVDDNGRLRLCVAQERRRDERAGRAEERSA